jgi:hypothetical protein
MMKRQLVMSLLLVLSACSSPNDPGVGGVTRSEAEALNDAAAMLDNNAVQPVAEPAGNSVASK